MSHVRSTTVSRPADTGRGPGSVANGKRIFILVLMLLAVGSITGCLQSSSPMMGNVTGKVFDSNGHVLKGATVEIYGGNHKVSTDELGRYTITGVEPGEKRIVATYQGRSVVINVNIIRGETLENADLTFAVIDGIPPVITDVAVGSLTENVAVITWVTNESSDSLVDYATGPIGVGTYTFQASDSAMVLDHSIQLSGLLPGVTYHFRVRSRDFALNEGISSEYQFMTPSGDAPATPVGFTVSPSVEMER
ncbi:MAG TPA: carboxypeptidase regulatory-like domain-containing protein, partial [Candidatus Ozemobacteraceae bacterium]|nr:carboxypeptidase regulatory-like domain-containing protein [Candidatus Ozemobacteraceae bacterium]